MITTVVGLLLRTRRSVGRIFSASEIILGRCDLYRGRFSESEVVLCLGKQIRKIAHEGELGILVLHSNAEDFLRALKVQFGFLCDAPELYKELPSRIKVAASLGELKGIPNIIAITAGKRAILTTPKLMRRIKYERVSEEAFIDYVTRKATILGSQGSAPKATAEKYPIGINQSGKVFSIDLLEHHHAMILGASGSGKTVLLGSILSAITEEVDAEQIRFLVLDFKGGTGLRGFAKTAHCDHIATDLEIADAKRVLRVLESEIRTRECEILESEKVDAKAAGLPRLLVVIDELPALLTQLPDAADRLNDIAQRGRGLGIHLLLAAQTLKGLPQSLLANIGCRLLLHHRDNHERETFAGKGGLINVEVGQFLADTQVYSVINRASQTSHEDNHRDLARNPAALLGNLENPAQSSRAFRSSWLPALPKYYESPNPAILGIIDDLDARIQRELNVMGLGNFVTITAHPRSGGSGIMDSFAVAWDSKRLQDPEEVWDAVENAFQEEDHSSAIIIDDFDAVLERLPAEWGFELQQRLRAIASERRHRLALLAKNEAVLRGFQSWATAVIELDRKIVGRGRINSGQDIQFSLAKVLETSEKAVSNHLANKSIEDIRVLTSTVYTSRQQQAVKRFGASRVRHISIWKPELSPQIFWRVDLLDFRMFMQLRELPPPTIGSSSALILIDGRFERVSL